MSKPAAAKAKGELAKVLTIESCADGVKKHHVTENAHRVMQGFYLMNAQAILSQRGEEKTRATVARVSVSDYANADANTPGFDVWLLDNFQGVISRRTAFNYIQAAVNAELKIGMGEKAAQRAVVKFLEKLAAEGKRLSDAYVKALPEEAGEGTKKPSDGKEGTLTEQDRAVQLVMPWFDDIAKIAKEGSPFEEALYEMRDEDFADAEHKLRVAMDTLVAVKKERAARARARGTRAGK